MPERVHYEVDPHNRLIIRKTGTPSSIPTYRCIAEGVFRVDKGNHLSYHLKQTAVQAAPQQIKFSGSWSLDKKHNLLFTLNQWGNQIAGNKLIIKGTVADVRGDRLLFAVTTKAPDGHTRLYALQLNGRWQADRNNRLSFTVERAKRPHDALVFDGAWDVNRTHQLAYRYSRKDLKRKKKHVHVLTFEGHWDIAGRNRLRYVVSKQLRSVFEFRSSIGIPVKRGKRHALRYEIGITLKTRKKPRRRRVTLFGAWKIDERKGLLFEVAYEKDRVHAVTFGADIRITKRDKLEFRLKNRLNEDLGIQLRLSRKHFGKAGEAFIKALRSRKEVTIAAGVGILW